MLPGTGLPCGSVTVSDALTPTASLNVELTEGLSAILVAPAFGITAVTVGGVVSIGATVLNTGSTQ